MLTDNKILTFSKFDHQISRDTEEFVVIIFILQKIIIYKSTFHLDEDDYNRRIRWEYDILYENRFVLLRKKN